MILSCPNCSTRYRANPEAIGSQGRKVRCASCAHVWAVMPEPAAELPVLEPIAETEPKLPHRAFRERAEARRRKATKAAAGGAWGGLAVAVTGALVATFLFRADIVSFWPQASSAYAMVGVEANPYGVSIEDFSVERVTEGDLPTVVIEGVVRNVDRRARPAPSLRAALLDEDSQPVLTWTVLVEGGDMASGESREFRTVVADPPHAAAQAEVTLTGVNTATPPVVGQPDDISPSDHADAGH